MTSSVSPIEPAWPRSAVRSIRWLARLFQIWRSPNRRFLNTPPGHFYSPLPDAAELERDVDRIYAPVADNLPGIEMDVTGQLQLVEESASTLAQIQLPINPSPEWRYFTDNIYFPITDAISLAAIVMKYRPKRVVEVGSGFSSVCVLDLADQLLNGQIQLTCVEPYPDRLLSLLRPNDHNNVSILSQRVQDVKTEVFSSLEPNDILFIDSSHVSKIGSDVNYLFFNILPNLRKGVLVHIHDVFWPFEYPPKWLAEGRAWNETYLLRAFLYGNSHFRIRLFGSYLEAMHSKVLFQHWPRIVERAQSNQSIGSASIWFEKVS